MKAMFDRGALTLEARISDDCGPMSAPRPNLHIGSRPMTILRAPPTPPRWRSAIKGLALGNGFAPSTASQRAWSADLPFRSRRAVATALVFLLLAAPGLCACTSDELDCSLGAMKRSCPSGTVGFDRMEAQLRRAERICLHMRLEPGSDAYAACLAQEGPVRPPPTATSFYRLGGSPAPGP